MSQVRDGEVKSPRPRGVLAICAKASGVFATAASALLCICTVASATGDVNVPFCPAAEASPGFRSYLPDCRAYELVTPMYAGGQHSKGPEVRLPPMSANGEHLLMVNYGGFAETENLENDGYEYGALYELSRTPGGWSTEALDPPASEYSRREFSDLASADLSRTLWELQVPPHTGEELPIEPPRGVRAPNNATFAVREAAGGGKGSFTFVGPVTAPGHVPSVGQRGEPQLGGLLGASAELSHILFIVPKAGKQSWPGDSTIEGAEALYEYGGTGEHEPSLVGVKNQASLAAEAASEHKEHINEAAQLISQCGSKLGDWGVSTVSNAVSAGGEVVYFTAAAATEGPEKDACDEFGEGSGPPVNELYARVDATHTVDVSEPAVTLAEKPNAQGYAAKTRPPKKARNAVPLSTRAPPKTAPRSSSPPPSRSSTKTKTKVATCMRLS